MLHSFTTTWIITVPAAMSKFFQAACNISFRMEGEGRHHRKTKEKKGYISNERDTVV